MKFIIMSILSLLPFTVLSQYVYFQSPTNQWKNTPAQINETVIDIYPKGNFTEIDLFISFSSTNPEEFADEEFIELVSFFELPEDVSVSDLWLWYEDEILIAHILDRWTANRVYESIVNRQRDPAIIYKNSSTNYELRVYPFLPSQMRKIKLSFIIPTEITENSSSIQIPTFFLQAIDEINTEPIIRYWTEESDPVLNLNEFSNAIFSSATDSIGNKYWEAELYEDQFNKTSITLTKQQSTTNVNLATYIDTLNGEQFFSFSLIPQDILEIDISKKVAVIFDIALSNVTLSKSELKESLKISLKKSFTKEDKFNLIFSNLSARKLSDVWLSGSDVVIDSLFNTFDESDISGFSNLDDNLAMSIDFINEMNGDGEVLLISSSDTYLNFQDANAFSESIFEYAKEDLPKITIIDIQNEDIDGRWGNNIWYQGNEYLYKILVIESGGELFNQYDSWDISQRMDMGFSYLEGVISDYDIYSTFDNGFSYNRFSNGGVSKLALSNTFIQTGKYYGNLPLTIQFSGTFRDTVFNQQLVINESNNSDSTLKRFWVSNKIRQMETSFPNNEEIAQIIDYSIESRILSRYTSFLALEPDDSSLIDLENQEDGGNLTSTEEEDTPNSFAVDTISAYPNPFNPSVNIEVNLSQGWNPSSSSIVIYNMLGQKVAELETSQFLGQTSFIVNWNINSFRSQLSTGIYIVRVVTPYTSKVIKITYLK